MKKIISLFFLLVLISCNDKKQESESDNTLKIDTIQALNEVISTEDEPKEAQKLAVNYAEHKEILDVLTIIPDSTMPSWGWKPNERKDFVKFIAQNNVTPDTSKNFSKIVSIKPNTLKIQVVDGSWVLSIYKIKADHYIVITDDMVGDGNEILAFEYDKGQLKYIKLKEVFGDYFSSLLVDKNNVKCNELLEENKIGFEYDFDSETAVEISNSFYLKENENKDCFNGNTLLFQFNKTSKKFDLVKKYWSNPKE
ncbi:hypothetical protein [Flavobacterium sp. '19STA2R22 D10 B1']|uniref:hypothetical protein n=1 Tax=Flavobacterium aerium TaxID=3037261 RepID=UPI00278C29E3|nr:hypothetical protein [Flavobacterium sp. '19STA2R22 D10 B1']